MSTTILSEAEWSVAGNEYDESIARCDETYQLRQRVGQLERLNTSLAAQVDRMRPVVDAALYWYGGGAGWSGRLAETLCTYEHTLAALGKGSGG